MCDCYVAKCEMCGCEMSIHISDFCVCRDEVHPFCDKCTKIHPYSDYIDWTIGTINAICSSKSWFFDVITDEDQVEGGEIGRVVLILCDVPEPKAHGIHLN